MEYRAWSLAELAERLGAESRTELRYKLALEFVRGYLDEAPVDRARLIEERPSLIGDRRWDSLVAALGDHYAYHDELPKPAWTDEPERFCHPPFWPVDTPGVRTMSRVHAPAAFLRHGVLVMPEDLVPV